MRNLKHWIGAALLAQPFYAEEIRMVRLMVPTWSFGLPPPLSDRALAAAPDNVPTCP